MQNLKILVTGGMGFLGKELVKQLVEKKYWVRVDDLQDWNRIGNSHVQGDLRDKKISFEALKDIDIVIHLAAATGGIGYYSEHPGSIINYNNQLYSSVFDACLIHDIQRIIYISS